MQSLDLSLLQKQELSQFQIQALNFLTMSQEDLVKTLKEKQSTNPLLKLESKEEKKDQRQSDYSSSSYKSKKDLEEESQKHEDFLNSIELKDESLYTHLVKQIDLLELDEQEKELAKLIVSCLDDNGRLIYTKDEIISSFDTVDEKLRASLYTKLILIISSLDPPGCASRDVYDSLYLQLIAKENELNKNDKNLNHNKKIFNLAKKLVNKEDFLLFSKEKYITIAKKYNSFDRKITSSDVQEAFDLIKTLDPYPAREYTRNSLIYLKPSILLSIKDNNIIIKINDDILPEISIDESYDSEKNSKDDKKYIQSCKNEIKTLSSFIQRRNDTLCKVAYYMVSKQLNWILEKTKIKSTLGLSEIANYSSMAISTVSRIVANNSLQFKNKIIPLSDLLEKKSSDENSKSKVVSEIKEILSSFDKKPSDEKIKELLEERGIKIARRTISKYRKEYM